MNHRAMRSMLALGAVLVLSLAPLACRSRAMPTPIYVYTTPTPSPSPAGVTPTPAPSGGETPASTPTPVATAQASASASGLAAAACSGNEDNKAFFAAAAGAMRWNVYCAVLPGSWHVTAGAFTRRNGGALDVGYQGPHGAQLGLMEGSYCLTSPSACSPHDAVIGPAAFGDLAGTLYTYTPSPGQTLYIIYVSPGTRHAYAISGLGLSEASFRSIAADLYKVPRP
jgi:hypothetical protein